MGAASGLESTSNVRFWVNCRALVGLFISGSMVLVKLVPAKYGCFFDPFAVFSDFTSDTVQLFWCTVGGDVWGVEGVGFCECSHSNTESSNVLGLLNTAFVPGGGVLVVFVGTVSGVSQNIK